MLEKDPFRTATVFVAFGYVYPQASLAKHVAWDSSTFSNIISLASFEKSEYPNSKAQI